MTECIWERSSETFRPVDAVYAGPLMSVPERVFLKQTFGYSAEVLIPSSNDACSSLDSYFEHVNHGRPFILIGPDSDDYIGSHPELGDRLVAAYGEKDLSSATLREDVRLAIESFIRTRTYCLRDRVAEECEI